MIILCLIVILLFLFCLILWFRQDKIEETQRVLVNIVKEILEIFKEESKVKK